MIVRFEIEGAGQLTYSELVTHLLHDLRVQVLDLVDNPDFDCEHFFWEAHKQVSEIEAELIREIVLG
jgi:hypothetical protein